MDDSISDGEILRMFEAVRQDLKEIKAQVKITNGRVSSLERWKYATVGGLAVVTTVVVPIFLSMVVGK